MAGDAPKSSFSVDGLITQAENAYRDHRDDIRNTAAAGLTARVVSRLALSHPAAIAAAGVGSLVLSDAVLTAVEERVRRVGLKRFIANPNVYLRGVRTIVPGLLYKTSGPMGMPGHEHTSRVFAPGLRNVLRVALRLGLPIVITSGWDPNDPRPNHRTPGHSWDIRVQGLHYTQLPALKAAFRAAGYQLDLYGPSFGTPKLMGHEIADHGHLNRIRSR